MFREVGPYHCAHTGLGQRTWQSHYICIFVFRNIQLFSGEPKFTTRCFSTAFRFNDFQRSRTFQILSVDIHLMTSNTMFSEKKFNDLSFKAQCINIVLMFTLHTSSKYISNMWIGYNRVNINGNCDAEKWHEIKSVPLMLYVELKLVVRKATTNRKKKHFYIFP